MTGERRLASLIRERASLIEPPFDIEALIERHAEVEDDEFPVRRVDAVLLNLATNSPRILVNTATCGQGTRRRRFTLAHELGHIVIPWHLAYIGCAAGDRPWHDGEHRTLEREANEFASELLMPRDWIRARLASGMAAAFEISELAETSVTAATIAVAGALESGYQFAITDGLTGEVRYAGRSHGTSGRPYVNKGDLLDPGIFNDISDEALSEDTAAGRVYWWRFAREREVARTDYPPYIEIRDMILRDLELPEGAREALMRSVSGIVGSANSSPRKQLTAEELHARLHLSFRRRTDEPIVEFREHSMFPDFIEAAAHQLRERA